MSRALSAALAAAAFFALSCSTTPKFEKLPDPAWKARMRTEPSTGKKGDPEARDRWYWEQRAYPAGSVPIEVHRAAVQRELIDGQRYRIEAEDGWESIGPAPLLDITYGFSTAQNSSGRALSLAIHPNDPNILFLGTAQGGIWKSTDRGATWHSVAEESLPTLAINIVRYKPDDPNVMYAATGEPNGSTSIHGTGLIRSTDGGATWQPLPRKGNGWNFEYAAVTGLHFDARDARTMYVSTATIVGVNFFRTPPNQPTTGIFKSTDGGETWTLLRAATRYTVQGAPSASVGIIDLEYGGANAPDLLFASEWYGGILKSNDAGASWTFATPRKSNGVGDLPAPVTSLSFFDNSTRRYLELTRFANSTIAPEFRRVEIALSSKNPNVLYAGYEVTFNQLDYDGSGKYELARDRTTSRGMLFKSEDGGATWKSLGSMMDGIPDYCGAQCTYDNVIKVNPDNENDVLIGGMANYNFLMPDPIDKPTRLLEMPWRGMIYRSLDGGKSWVDTTPHCTKLTTEPVGKDGNLPVYRCAQMDTTKVIHPDIHDIVYGPNGSIYVMNDGGIYRGSQSTGTPTEVPKTLGRRRSVGAKPSGSFAGLAYTWDNLNEGLSTLQFYRVASHPTDPNIIMGGMQDNSSGYWNGTTWQGWGAGDGTIALFDPVDPNYVYIGTPGEIHRHDGGGEKDFTDTSGWRWGVFGSDLNDNETAGFITVFALDPVSPNITYGASNRGLYRSTERGEGSKRLVPQMTTDGTPSSISVSRVNHNIVWAGTANGAIYRYEIAADGTATAKRLDTGLPNRYVSGVAAGFDSANTVYAVFNGYDANTPATPGKVFVSTNAGQTWSNISGNLPDVPATAIALHPTDKNRIWIATDAAVYTTADGGKTWTSDRRNMPVVAVQDLHYNANTGYLVAGTHGRGVWRMKVGTGTGATQR